MEFLVHANTRGARNGKMVAGSSNRTKTDGRGCGKGRIKVKDSDRANTHERKSKLKMVVGSSESPKLLDSLETEKDMRLDH